MTARPYRPYIRHHWISRGLNGNTATCFVCGISEHTWLKKIENNPMIQWDCKAMQDKNKAHKP